MGPKKIKLDDKQPTLSFFMPDNNNNTTNAEDKEILIATKLDNQPSAASSRNRSFKTHWLNLYSWLRFDESSKSMYCSLCANAKKRNGMVKEAKCTNFQMCTLARHAGLNDHVALVQAPALSKDLKNLNQKHESKHDAAIKVLFKALHWIVTEDIPLTKFKSLVDFLHELDQTGHMLSDLRALKLSNINYDSSYTSSQLLECLSDVVECNLQSELSQSKFVTALADESTDIANHKRLVIYTQIISDDMKPSTRFLTNIQCEDATGKGIADSILTEFSKRGVQPEKIMSLGSDGASVMTGKVKGCAAVMKRSNPHMNNVHCVAHKLALCTSQAAEGIQSLKQHQQVLTDLFYYFKGSAKRAAKLQAIQRVLEDPCLTIKEIHSVRWLSYFNALTTIYRTIDSLCTYLADVGTEDPKANGLKKKISTDKFVSLTYMMMDAMAPVTILSQFFQTENVDIALVKVKLDMCIDDLKKVKSLESPYLSQLQTDLPPGESLFKGQHHITKTNFNIQTVTHEFVDSLISNIKSRFTDDDLLSAFSVLAMRPLSFLTPSQLTEYGNSEIDMLCDFFGQPRTSTWSENGEHHDKTSPALIDPKEVQNEWNMLKKVVVAEQYPRDCMWQLWQLITKYHKEFPNLTILAQLALTSSVHTAGCERGFSVQNRILTTFRNRLTFDTQQQLMKIKIDGNERGDFNFDLALLKWKQAKDRRIYELKKLK